MNAPVRRFPREPDDARGTATIAGRSGRIESLERGWLSGSISEDGTPTQDTVLIAVNGRTIGKAVVSWSASARSERPIASGSWTLDARELPPEFLLEDRLTFALALPGEAAPLDTIDIAPSQIFSAGDLQKGRGRLEGYIDGTEGGGIRGWVWSPTEPTRRIKVHVFVEDRFCGVVEASRPRPDLERSGRGDGRYGFFVQARRFFELTGSPAPKVRVVSVEPEFWDVPFAPHTRSHPPLTRRAPVGKLPSTSRDLVAILTGAESFPKKIYAIDHVVRTMPDPASADYILLALEFLRIELTNAAMAPSVGLGDRLVAWWHQRVIRSRIRRLAALAEATVASQHLLNAASCGGSPEASKGPRVPQDPRAHPRTP